MQNLQNVITTIVLDTRRKKKDNTYPVKLRVTFQRQQKLYTLKLSLSKSDYEKVIGSKPRGKFKNTSLWLNEIENKAIKIINKLSFFTFDKFEEQFFNHNRKGKDVNSYYKNYIDKLKEEQRFGTAEGYLASFKSVFSFYGKKTLLFEDITVDFLNKYEKWMLANGKSITTVGIYLRNLRKLYNDYIRDVNAPQSIYPFGRGRYVIPKGKNIKKALKIEDIKKLYYYEVEEMSEIHFAKDFFLLSYLCNGMNMTDIFRLKFKNIQDDKIYFYRTKTKRTSKADLKHVVVILTPEIQEIIDRWKNDNNNPENYIFPLITEIKDPEQQRLKIKYKTRTINSNLKKIFKDLDININGTTIYARHSFATIMRNSGASDEYISESVGHQNTQTTKNYLGSFVDDIKKEYANKLLAFKDKKQ